MSKGLKMGEVVIASSPVSVGLVAGLNLQQHTGHQGGAVGTAESPVKSGARLGAARPLALGDARTQRCLRKCRADRATLGGSRHAHQQQDR
jgi:hypothetical protein